MSELKTLRGLSGLASRRHRDDSAKLNLVSLMDIFTILVFFLMVNSSEVQVLQQDQSVKLPESISEQVPEEALLVLVTESDILVQGKSVANPQAVLTRDEVIIPALKKELDYRAQRHWGSQAGVSGEEGALPLTIMGDAGVSYDVLKRIMATCSETAYRDVSLAVTRVYDANGVAVR